MFALEKVLSRKIHSKLTSVILGMRVIATSCELHKNTTPQEQSVMPATVHFLTWGILLLTHSVFGRISSHMIMHRARVWWRREASTSDLGEVGKISSDSRAKRHSWHQTNPQQQKLWLNEVQQKPSIWRFQPISNRPKGQNRDEKREC